MPRTALFRAKLAPNGQKTGKKAVLRKIGFPRGNAFARAGGEVILSFRVRARFSGAGDAPRAAVRSERIYDGKYEYSDTSEKQRADVLQCTGNGAMIRADGPRLRAGTE